jgi:hypothetical protein
MNPDTSAQKMREAARLARRVELERKLAQLSRQIEDPVIAPTVIFILAAVALAAIVGALYFAFR